MSTPLAAGVWTYDPAHSRVGFGLRHLGISTLQGRFGTADATLTVGDSAASSSLTAEVDMSSIDTGDENRDEHLRGNDFFNVDTNPKMTFASTAISDDGDGNWTVVGDLTVNGQTNPVELAVSFHGTETFPFDGSTHAGFRATGVVDRTKFGIDFNVPLSSGGPMLSDNVDIVLDVQLVGPAD